MIISIIHDFPCKKDTRAKSWFPVIHLIMEFQSIRLFIPSIFPLSLNFKPLSLPQRRDNSCNDEKDFDFENVVIIVKVRVNFLPKVILFEVSPWKSFLENFIDTFRTSWRGNFRWKLEQLAWAWLHRSGRHCSEIGAERLVKDAYKSSRASTLNAIDTLNFPIRWQQMFLRVRLNATMNSLIISSFFFFFLYW